MSNKIHQRYLSTISRSSYIVYIPRWERTDKGHPMIHTASIHREGEEGNPRSWISMDIVAVLAFLAKKKKKISTRSRYKDRRYTNLIRGRDREAATTPTTRYSYFLV